MSHRLRTLLAGMALCAITIAGVVAVPRTLRALAFFQVETVRVIGTHYMAPHDVLTLTGIGKGSNVFDDRTPWRHALLAHPLVTDVGIRRELPRTLVLRIREAEPIALVPLPALQPVDADGQVLPIDPAATPMDLPVVAAATTVDYEGRLDDATSLRLLRRLAALRMLDPELAALVSALAAGEDGSMRLELLAPAGAGVLLPGERNLEFYQLRLVLDELEARGEVARLGTVDLRYRDQVVVSLKQSVN